MEAWLIGHAKANVWCRPQLDHLLTVKPRRLTSPEGETYGVSVSRYSIRLPIPELWYHVFQLGGLSTSILGIEKIGNQWARMDRVVNAYSTSIVIYNDSGRVMPLHLTWLRKLPNGNVIIAVEGHITQIDFGVDDLYVRFYDGFIQSSTHMNPDIHKLEAHSSVVENPLQILNAITTYKELDAKGGEVKAYVNGYELDVLTSNDMKPWDLVDIVHDGLVKETHYFDVDSLSTFTSTLDKCRKYLLHPPKHSNVIEFYNDVTISVYHGNDGRHYFQHLTNSLRQVTHHDYTIPTHRIQELITANDSWINSKDVRIKISTRFSGMDRPLIFEENRICELYKLSDKLIVDAMVGINSTVPEWQASVLETSPYVQVMAASCRRISNELCTDAYGYNAISHYVADTPQRPVLDSGELVSVLPPLLACNSTVYEYDRHGLLLGSHLHSSTSVDEYRCHDEATDLIEVIEGAGSSEIMVEYNATNFKMVPGVNYRVYQDRLKSGVPQFDYEDITGDTDAYTVAEDGTVNWKIDLTRRQPAIISDYGFLAYSFVGDLTDGLLRFTINHNDKGNAHILYFTPEVLEIWMNGRILVPYVDFYVKWPEVIICNRKYLSNGTYERPNITVRCRGLADKLRVPKTGFVLDSMLSNNTRFDVRDDKVIRIAIDGKLKVRSDIKFAEDHNGLIVDEREGAPYFISDPTIPLRCVTHRNTYELRDEARSIDQRVEDYMSIYLPQKPAALGKAITTRHDVFSPILNKVIADLRSGILRPIEDDDTNIISDRQFDALMENYHPLLDYDPIRNNANLIHIEVLPHCYINTIELTPIQYSLIGRINDRYLFGRVIINKSLTVKVIS